MVTSQIINNFFLKWIRVDESSSFVYVENYISTTFTIYFRLSFGIPKAVILHISITSSSVSAIWWP